jgi:hypothetical protein
MQPFSLVTHVFLLVLVSLVLTATWNAYTRRIVPFNIADELIFFAKVHTSDLVWKCQKKRTSGPNSDNFFMRLSLEALFQITVRPNNKPLILFYFWPIRRVHE